MQIPFYVESIRGHDIFSVPQEQVQGEVEKHLNEDKLVTLEQENGSTEILTKTDIPNQLETTEEDDEEEGYREEEKEDKIPTEEEQKENIEWAKKFKETKSATITNKSKGG